MGRADAFIFFGISGTDDAESSPTRLLDAKQRYVQGVVLRRGLLVSGSTPEKVSPDSTGHLLVLLLFLLFSLVLRTKLGPFLVFLLAFVFFSFVAHIRFSLLESRVSRRLLLGNVTEQ